LPVLEVAVSAGCPLRTSGGVTRATGDVTPTVLKTDMGTWVTSATVVGSAGWNPVELVLGVVPPVTLMMTSTTTTTTTSPMASQVKSPAGRPPLTGALLGPPLVGVLLGGGDLATILLVKFSPPT
jgi:hypothetical protein